MLTRPLLLGHRGAPFAARENTIDAFRAALDEGADGVELDVLRTADGALALHHDTVVGEVPVAHLTRAALAERIGPVDTLEDVFAALPSTAWVFVEIKRQRSAFEALTVEGVLALVQARPDYTWVGSFDPLISALVRARAPQVRTGLIVDRDSLGPADAVATDADVVSMEHPLATGPLLRSFAPRTTLAWPVDAEADMDRCFDHFPHLSGIITKHPGIARARRDRR